RFLSDESCYALAPHPFPTRRSSDLSIIRVLQNSPGGWRALGSGRGWLLCAQGEDALGKCGRTQNPCASIPRGTLNLLRKFSRATAAVSSTIWPSSKMVLRRAKSSSLTV